MGYSVSAANAGCSIVLNAPDDNYYTTGTNALFNYTVTGNQSAYSCNLSIDDVRHGANTTATNNTATALTSNGSLTDKKDMIWYVECINGTNTCNSTTREITKGTASIEGMDSLDRVTGDFASIMEDNVIDLVIAVAVIGIVGLFIVIIHKYLSKAGIGK